MNAERLMLLGGVLAFVLTVLWVRTRALREQYAVIWLAVATLLLLCGLFPRVLETFAEASRLSYPSAVLFVSLAAIYLFSFGVSVSLTRQNRRNVRLTQELALLEHRVRQLEAALAARATSEADMHEPGSPASDAPPEWSAESCADQTVGLAGDRAGPRPA